MLTEYSRIDESVKKTIPQFQQLILSDFLQYPDFENLASKICFNGKTKMADYVSHLEVFDVNAAKYNGGKSFKIESLRFDEIDSVSHRWKYIQPTELPKYYFFKKEEFETYEKLLENYNGFFYLCDDDFVTKIDSLFTVNLNGYKTGNNKLFVKVVNEDFKIVIDTKRNRKRMETIEDYTYPLIYIEFDKKKYFFNAGIDTLSYFFVGTNSYIYFFYNNRKISKRSEGPIVYHDIETNKYILSNSKENLVRFNKYIFLNAELFIHYFQVFEKWVVDVLVPSIKSDTAI